VEPALLQDDHWAQRDDESELYDVTAVGVAEQAELMHDATEVAWVAWQ
jgi:hypothetical protein